MPWPGPSLTRTGIAKYAKPWLTIDCGDWTYGTPQLWVAATDRNHTLKIGRYCSIAEPSEIYVGSHGSHPTDAITSYPMGLAVSEAVRSASDPAVALRDLFAFSEKSLDRNLSVIIGDDVWIGRHVTILAGVTIGTGAVIGTRSVVTKDIPPYAIATGSPAGIMRYRHDENTIAHLLESEWWRLEPDEIWRRCGSLITSSTMVRQILPLLRK